MASVTRKPQRTRAERRAAMVRQLLQATEELLEQGESFTELSVERLVSHAGISRSTFYVYFEDKGALLREMSADVMVQLLHAAEVWWNSAPDAGRAEIRRSMADVVERYRPHAAIMAAVVDSAPYDPAVREQFLTLMQRYEQEIDTHIRAGQAAGYVRQGLPPKETAALLCWMAERSLYQEMRNVADPTAVERFIDALTAVVWNTLYAGVKTDDGQPIAS